MRCNVLMIGFTIAIRIGPKDERPCMLHILITLQQTPEVDYCDRRIRALWGVLLMLHIYDACI